MGLRIEFEVRLYLSKVYNRQGFYIPFVHSRLQKRDSNICQDSKCINIVLLTFSDRSASVHSIESNQSQMLG